MKQNDREREQELLEFYMQHTLPNDEDNLRAIKQRIGSDCFAKKRMLAHKRKAKGYFSLSAACFAVCVGTYSGYHILLSYVNGQPHNVSTHIDRLIGNLQSPAMLTGIGTALVALLLCSIIFLLAGLKEKNK